MKDNVEVDNLFNTILLLDSLSEAQAFFRDLLTENEIAEFSNRWQAAQMLRDKVSYIKITESTGLSSTTVARISKWLTNGTGGYRNMLTKVNAHHTSLAKGLGKA